MRCRAEAYVRRWDWNELGALLQKSDLFLGHDTGMMHLATAVGTPVVAVFGPSDPQIYGPYGEHARFVWKPTVQSPCFYNGEAVAECSCAMQCMRNIAVVDVVAAVDTLLFGDHIEGTR
jgi:ADP-heptose:LPS heptosyltransferase